MKDCNSARVIDFSLKTPCYFRSCRSTDSVKMFSSCPRESIYQEGQLEEARLELEAAVKVVADAADLHELLHLGLFADFNLSEFGVKKCVLKSKCFDKILTKGPGLNVFGAGFSRFLPVFIPKNHPPVFHGL